MNTGCNGLVGNGQDNLSNIMLHLFGGYLCTCTCLVFMHFMFSYMGLRSSMSVKLKIFN